MDLFGNLPRDVAINILSRLPIPSIIECKVVCRAWRNLINCREFVNGHQQPHLLVFARTIAFPRLKPVQIAPAPDKIKIEELNSNPMGMAIVRMDLFDSVPLVRSSVDGLILLLRREWEQQLQHVSLWVCNPITREYVKIPNPSDRDFGLGLPYPPQHRHPLVRQPFESETVTGAPPREYGNYNFGFGVSRSKQYKVVWISHSECRVYTLGTTGLWRSITLSGPGLRYNKWNTECELVGGKLYWLDPPESQTQTEISCFDLETEVFTYFSAPLPRRDLHHDCYRSLCVLDDCLCLCDVYGDEIEIWLMRGQGDWNKKLVISEHGFGRNHGYGYGYLFPIKVLEGDRNGNVNRMLLGTRSYATIHYYSNNNNNSDGGGGRTRIRWIYPSRIVHTIYDYPHAVVYTPSFLPLKTLLMDMEEDVRLF